jgi:AraC-like DNA-binding protein
MRLRPRSAALNAIAALVAELGHDPAPVMAAVGFDPADPGEDCLPPQAFQSALGHASALTGREDFGLTLARRRTMDAFGDLAPLLASAPSVGDALAQLLRLLPHLQDGGVRANIERDGDEAMLVGQVVLTDPPALEQQLDHLAGAAVALLRGLSRPDWTPDAVYLARRRPRSAAAYEAFFGAPVLFGQETMAVLFRAELLDRPVAQANLALNRLLYDHLAGRAATTAVDLADRVRERIWRGLGDGWRGEAGVAAELGLPRRTLQRRLALEGQSFRGLVEEVRIALARRLIRHSDAALGDIALALGYADPSIFSRFFRRHIGETPSAWRQRQSGMQARDEV